MIGKVLLAAPAGGAGVSAVSPLARSTLLFVAMLVMASAASSQPNAPDPAGGMTLERFLERQTARLMAADTDGDGRISRAELDAAAGTRGRDPSRRFDAMDANHDNYLDKAEIQAALTTRFHRMDRNGDGVVAPDERMGVRMRGQDEPEGVPAARQP